MEKDLPGKPGKPSDAQNAQSTSTSSTSTSMAGRIQSSAAGLLRSAMLPSSPSPSNSYAFAKGVSSSLESVSGSDKAGASSTSSASRRSAGAGVDSTFHRGSMTESGSGFRSQRPQPEIQSRSEQEFHHGGLTVDNVGVHDLSASKGKGRQTGEEERFNSVWSATGAATDTNTASAAHSDSVAQQERMDGQAVSNLLSSSSFDPISGPDDELGLEPELEPDMDFLTATRQQPSISSTSLIPDIDFVLSSLRDVPAQSQAEHLRDLPGVLEWLDLDAEYQDVVWGYLKPRVEEARREVQERSDRGEQALGDGPAVARLRMVLAHLKEKRMP